MSVSPAPPLTAPKDLSSQLHDVGFAVLEAAALASLVGVPASALGRWGALWNDLPPDPHLRDGGRYRRRRHGCFVVGADGAVVQAPHRPHWQPVEYNALHGGFERWFEPLDPAWAHEPEFAMLLRAMADLASHLRGTQPWYVEVHPFRIDCTGGIGRPTPEGAHRDGVDLVAVLLVARRNVKGGETRVFDARGPQGLRFTLAEPWSALLLDDERVIHETTPIQPLDPAHDAWRDTLVLTLRARGFQGPTP
jgi:hypothetical protein